MDEIKSRKTALTKVDPEIKSKKPDDLSEDDGLYTAMFLAMQARRTAIDKKDCDNENDSDSEHSF